MSEFDEPGQDAGAGLPDSEARNRLHAQWVELTARHQQLGREIAALVGQEDVVAGASEEAHSPGGTVGRQEDVEETVPLCEDEEMVYEVRAERAAQADRRALAARRAALVAAQQQVAAEIADVEAMLSG